MAKLITKEEAFMFNTDEGDTMDLNDFKEPGFYHSMVNAKNAPKDSAPGIFFVYSEKNKTKTIIIQFFISYFYETTLKLYTRFCALGNWSDWITI